MKPERIFLDQSDKNVYIDYYKSPLENPRDAMLVIPGGGYGMVCSDREGGPIALAFLERGMNAFVLNYRVGEGHQYPEQLIDAARAVAHIKKNAQEYAVNPERIFAVGFSAGGHLVGLLSTQHTYAEQLLNLPENFTRPTASIYAYPVVSTACPTHGGSFYNLVGKPLEDFTEEQMRLYSIEENVNAHTPPAFIWHTAEDTAVSVYGSLRLAESYLRAGVTVSLHIYPYGPHGVALGNDITRFGNDAWIQPLAEGWVDYAAEFIKTV